MLIYYDTDTKRTVEFDAFINFTWHNQMWWLLNDQSLLSAGGDSSQDEAEEEAKAITVKTCAHVHSYKFIIALTLRTHIKESY